jgi:serine/threonine protein kinase
MNTTTKQLAHTIRSQWRDGQTPDARAALEENPELEGDCSAVVELAYEEYWLRRGRGEEVDPADFLERFPGVRSRLRNMLAVDGALAYHPSAVYVGKADAPAPPTPPREKPDWPLPGEMWGDCLLLRELGVGAFSRVYLASERSAGDRPVVLKFSWHAGGEGHTLGRLHHDHIVPIHWARHDPCGWHVVCMPFYGSATLTDVQDRLYHRDSDSPPARAEALLDAIGRNVRANDPQPDVPLPGPDLRHLSFAEGVARLAERLAEALGFLHRRGLAHCDLKPSNVLLSPQGRPLLLDFNLARVGSEPADRVGGTFPYMAPEHLEAFLARRPLAAAEAAAADLFSLGVLLYELLTGRHPFGGPPHGAPEAAARQMLRMEHNGFRPIRECNPAVPERLARLVESCLAVDPARRPDAETLARQLRPPTRRRLLAPAVFLIAAGVTMPFLAAPPVPADRVQDSRKHREEGLADLRRYDTLTRTGESAAAQRSLHRADAAFKQAIACEPADVWKDHFRRGQVLLLLGKPQGARDCFLAAEQAQRKGPGPQDQDLYVRTLVHLSYSCTLSRQHEQALKYGQKALDAGPRTAALLNNLGYTALQVKEFSAASRYLAEALLRDSRLLEAHRNRAALGVALARKQNQPTPEHALSDIDRAIGLARQLGRESGQLYAEAVPIYAAACWDTRKEFARLGKLPADPVSHERASFLRQQFTFRQERTRQYLMDACRMGADLQTLLRFPCTREVLGRDFRLDQPTAPARPGNGPPASTESIGLVGPLASAGL